MYAHIAAAAQESATTESRRERLARHGHQGGLYSSAFALVALIAANTRAVKLDWLFGSTRASLVWIILGARFAVSLR